MEEGAAFIDFVFSFGEVLVGDVGEVVDVVEVGVVEVGGGGGDVSGDGEVDEEEGFGGALVDGGLDELVGEDD